LNWLVPTNKITNKLNLEEEEDEEEEEEEEEKRLGSGQQEDWANHYFFKYCGAFRINGGAQESVLYGAEGRMGWLMRPRSTSVWRHPHTGAGARTREPERESGGAP